MVCLACQEWIHVTPHWAWPTNTRKITFKCPKCTTTKDMEGIRYYDSKNIELFIR